MSTTDESPAAEDRLADIQALAPAILEALAMLETKIDNEWWSCNGGKAYHDAILEEKQEVTDLIALARKTLLNT